MFPTTVPKKLIEIIKFHASCPTNKLPSYVCALWNRLYPLIVINALLQTQSYQKYAEFFNQRIYRLYVLNNYDEIKSIFFNIYDKYAFKGYVNFRSKMFHQLKQEEICSSKQNQFKMENHLREQFFSWQWKQSNQHQKDNFFIYYFEGEDCLSIEIEPLAIRIKQFYQQKMSSDNEDEILENNESDGQSDKEIQIKLNSQEAISEPLFEKRYFPQSKRCNNEGLVNCYICQDCRSVFRINKKRALFHKINCSKRKQRLLVIAQPDNIVNQSLIEKVHEELNGHTGEQNSIQKLTAQVTSLKTQVRLILQNPGKSFIQKELAAKQLSKRIWDGAAESIRPIMQAKLQQQILLEGQGQVSMEVMIRTMKMGLIQRFYDFDLRELMISWSHKLSNACQQLIAESVQNKCRPETISRDNSASKQISKFSQYDLTCNSQKFLSFLALQSRYKRTNIVRFYHKLMRKFPYLKLKVLPINLNVYTFTFQRKILKIEDVKNLVISLWNKKQKILATDVWMTVCMGMRKTQLMQLFFCSEQGHFFRLIRIYEQKNQNNTNRCVPVSLMHLIQLSKTLYPINESRLGSLRDVCLRELGQFYGLRHVCLTNLMVALLSNSEMSFHRRSSTTIERYIDQQTSSLIDKAFQFKDFKIFLD